jgi:polyisoprenoid-binding protein YceI
MKLNKLFLAILAIAAFSFTITEATTYKVNTTESSVNWKGYKVTGSHNGSVGIKNGSLKMNEGRLQGASFEIDMTSIQVKDLQGAGATKLEGHLKSEDFFGTDKYPTSKLVITKVIPYGAGGDYKLVGNMTIKDITKEIKFKANVVETDGKVSAKADITVDRADFNISYKSGSFFDELGDKTIYDEFELTVNLVANK